MLIGGGSRRRQCGAISYITARRRFSVAPFFKLLLLKNKWPSCAFRKYRRRPLFFVSPISSRKVPYNVDACSPGAQPALHFGGAIFMNFHSMTSSCLFNCGTTFSQTVTYNNINVFLPADTKSIVQRNTFCTTLVNKNRQNRTFYISVGGWITGVKGNFWLAKFLTSRHMRMHRATFNISNTLRKLMIRA